MVRDGWRRYLEAAGGPDMPPYPNYRVATRLLVADWLRAGLPRAGIEAEIRRGRAHERVLVGRFPEWLGGERIAAPGCAP